MITARHRLPELELTDHIFQVPLDHKKPEGEQIQVFAREVSASNRDTKNFPWLLFLQGGPGFASPRIQDNHGKWWSRATQEYRVLLLDQRGTGLSTPVSHQTLARFATPEKQADYLKLFRADSIVRDAEFIRKELLGADTRWSALGQSYGGFCCATYLSLAPQGLREVFFTGGIPPLKRNIDEVYRATYRRVLNKNELYYSRYPDDAARSREIVDYLAHHETHLPNGDLLSAARFQQAGIVFGTSNGFEELHYLLEIAFVQGGNGKELNYAFLRGLENLTSFDTNPIYSLLHEPIYCEGAASGWSAQRIRAEYPQFDPYKNSEVLFTGEMVYPWTFEEIAVLKPLKETANLLAEFRNWPPLYDLPALQANTVPAVAAVYYNDMYVERAYSEEAAEAIRGIKLWVTSEYEHNGLRADGEKIFDRLVKMLRNDV